MTKQGDFETDIVETNAGDLRIMFLGHASLLMTFKGKNIHIDPFGEVAEYSKLPQADIIISTHEHFDHLDPKAIKAILKPSTVIIGNAAGIRQIGNGIALKNGEKHNLGDFELEVVPAYNILHKRENGQPFHPQGIGNGYILFFGDKRIYIAGDTENIPEMGNLKNIDIAFLPMNLPYTMTPEMVAMAAKTIRPRILYPYHYGNTDVTQLSKLLQTENIEIRIRKMA
jgi:L-ascorbate metabolism protein UlaG (beta-lactamase superfamily)